MGILILLYKWRRRLGELKTQNICTSTTIFVRKNVERSEVFLQYGKNKTGNVADRLTNELCGLLYNCLASLMAIDLEMEDSFSKEKCWDTFSISINCN